MVELRLTLIPAPGWPSEHLICKPNRRANVASTLNSNGAACGAVPGIGLLPNVPSDHIRRPSSTSVTPGSTVSDDL